MAIIGESIGKVRETLEGKMHLYNWKVESVEEVFTATINFRTRIRWGYCCQEGEAVSISEVIIPLGIYSGLLVFFMVLSARKRSTAIGKVLLISMFYLGAAAVLWEGYKSEEHHINDHSGYPPISFTKEAVLFEVVFTIYTILLLWVVWIINSRKTRKSNVISDK